MTVDSMARLVAANPVPEPPTVESPERLRRLIEDDARVLDLGERRNGSSTSDRRSRLRRRRSSPCPYASPRVWSAWCSPPGPPVPV